MISSIFSRATASKPTNLGEAIRAHAAARPKHVAIVAAGLPTLSYRMLQAEIDATRAALRAAGFGRDARIAVAIANNAQAARAIIATVCSATAVPIDPKLTLAEVERCLRIVRPQAVLVLRDTESAARAAAAQHGLPVIEAGFSAKGNLEVDVPSVGPVASAVEPDADAPAFILHTSGTSADPNLVPFSHRNLLAVTERLQTWFRLGPDDCCLSVSPVYYSHALTTTVLPPLLTGGSAAFPRVPTQVDIVEWFGELKPTWYSAGPTLHLAVLEKFEAQGAARTPHKLRFLSTAGAPMGREMFERMQNVLGVPILEHYGSSETAQIASNCPPPGPSKQGTVGIPWPGILKIADDEGRPVPAGERGEVMITGPSVMAGYLNAPERNSTIFLDGWYRTGDVGSLDGEGFLTLHGRDKELINRGGEKISPVEIDQALMRHPGVAQAAAYAVPHPRLGEDIAAAVMLKPGAQVTSLQLREFLHAELAQFKVPRRIAIVDELPRGITGKVLRRRLTEMAQSKGIDRV